MDQHYNTPVQSIQESKIKPYIRHASPPILPSLKVIEDNKGDGYTNTIEDCEVNEELTYAKENKRYQVGSNELINNYYLDKDYRVD